MKLLRDQVLHILSKEHFKSEKLGNKQIFQTADRLFGQRSDDNFGRIPCDVDFGQIPGGGNFGCSIPAAATFWSLSRSRSRGSVTAPQSQESIHSHTLSQIQTSLASSCAMHSIPGHSIPGEVWTIFSASPDVSALHDLAPETQILINQICPHVERKRSVCHLYKKQSHFEIESEI